MKKMLSFVLVIALVLVTSVPVNATEIKSSVEQLAYMDLEQASTEIQAKILEARREIIFSHSWVADGLQGAVYDRYGNVVEELPHFSEIFPSDWEIPVFTTSENNASHSNNSTKSIQAVNEEEFMDFIFSDTLELRVPTTGHNSPAFTSFETTYWHNHYYLSMNYVYTRALDRVANTNCANNFNVGYTNADTGESLGWMTNIESYDAFGITPPANTEIEVRASMYSDDPDISSGDWEVEVSAFCEILNG